MTPHIYTAHIFPQNGNTPQPHFSTQWFDLDLGHTTLILTGSTTWL